MTRLPANPLREISRNATGRFSAWLLCALLLTLVAPASSCEACAPKECPPDRAGTCAQLAEVLHQQEEGAVCTETVRQFLRRAGLVR